METTQKPSDLLIFIGSVAKYFDADGNLTELEKRLNLKYLVVQVDAESPAKIFLMEIDNPYSYHAEALLSYMKKNNLTKIKVNGGGKITLTRGFVMVHERSYAFGHASSKEVKDLISQIWPSLRMNMMTENQNEIMEINGKLFDIDQIKYHADNP